MTRDNEYTPLEQLPEIHRKRWLAAKALFQNIKDLAVSLNAEILYSNTIIKPNQIEIDGDKCQ